MHEFDITHHGQTDASDYAAHLHEQAEQLGSERTVIGAEGVDNDDTDPHAGDATRDPAAPIDTTPIGNGGDVAANEVKGKPDTADTARPARVGEGVVPLAVDTAGTVAEPEQVADEEVLEPTGVTDAAVGTGETDEVDDTHLPPEEIAATFERWKRGEVVQSTSMPIDRIEVSDAEVDALRDRQPARLGEYIIIDQPDLRSADSPYAQRRTGLSEAQLNLLSELDDRVMEAVRADIARNGYGPVDEARHEIEIGMFDPGKRAIGWHVDNPQSMFVRYVMTVGDSGSTRFVHGPTQQTDLDIFNGIITSTIDAGPDSQHQEIAYDNGVLTRFTSSTVLHDIPDRGGFRIFFTVHVDLLPEERSDEM